MEFEARIRVLADRLPDQLPNIQSASGARSALVLPFIAALGYNIFDSSEVTTELSLGAAHPAAVDYALLRAGEPLLLFKVHAPHSTLPQHPTAWMEALWARDPSPICSESDGVRYHFFGAIAADDPAGPLLTFDLQHPDADSIHSLAHLTRGAFDPQAVRLAAQRSQLQVEILRALEAELAAPSDDFLRLLAARVQLGEAAPPLRRAFPALVRDALAAPPAHTTALVRRIAPPPQPQGPTLRPQPLRALTDSGPPPSARPWANFSAGLGVGAVLTLLLALLGFLFVPRTAVPAPVAAVPPAQGTLVAELAILLTPSVTPPPPTAVPTDALPLVANAPTATPAPTPAIVKLTVPLASADDDVEEEVANGEMNLNSSDLEMVGDGVNSDPQRVGLRFAGVDVPPGATIHRALLRFTSDEAGRAPTLLMFRGEATGNALPFAWDDYNLSSRSPTKAYVVWEDVAPWFLEHETQLSPDMAPIVQEIVSRADWQPGNAIAIIISGSGERTAESMDGDPARAPQLLLEWSVPAAP